MMMIEVGKTDNDMLQEHFFPVPELVNHFAWLYQSTDRGSHDFRNCFYGNAFAMKNKGLGQNPSACQAQSFVCSGFMLILYRDPTYRGVTYAQVYHFIETQKLIPGICSSNNLEIFLYILLW